jgi:hypothetical protein
MSSDEPTKPNVPPKPAAYRTLIPAGSAPAPSVPSAPAAKPAAAKPEPAKAETPTDSKDENRPDPTRFGDWEVKGRCIDF